MAAWLMRGVSVRRIIQYYPVKISCFWELFCFLTCDYVGAYFVLLFSQMGRQLGSMFYVLEVWETNAGFQLSAAQFSRVSIRTCQIVKIVSLWKSGLMFVILFLLHVTRRGLRGVHVGVGLPSFWKWSSFVLRMHLSIQQSSFLRCFGADWLVLGWTNHVACPAPKAKLGVGHQGNGIRNRGKQLQSPFSVSKCW